MKQHSFSRKGNGTSYIYLETRENSYAAQQQGGYMSGDLMPEISTLATENTVFSNTDLPMGGPTNVMGTGWTSAAMVAYTTGLPLNIPVDSDLEEAASALPGAANLNDILEQAGYSQTFIMGSDAAFGARDLILETHGGSIALTTMKLRPGGIYLRTIKLGGGLRISAYIKLPSRS